jgi:hypothetical protein
MTAATVHCHAQDTTKVAVAAPSVQLSETEWKSVTGYFSSPQNQDMKVEFTTADGLLVAKLLWNGSVIHLVPSSPLTFTSKEMEHDEPIRLTFRRDASGEVNELEVDKQGVWKRVRNYKADPPKQEMAHTPDQIKPFEGLYQAKFNPTLFLKSNERDNHLWLKQLWDGGEVAFTMISDTGFYAPAAPQFNLEFHKDQKGVVTGMTAFKRDEWIKKEKPHFTTGEMNALNGEYVSKDDPDNSIRISVKGDQLVLTQLWDKKEHVLDALADIYFYNAKESYPLVVMKDPSGKITGLVVLTTNTFIRKN